MRRLSVALCALAAFTPFVASDKPADDTHQINLNGHTFTLPEGFTIELAARTPLVDRPIVADLDDHGRLVVADSSGSNEKVADQLAKKPHRIVRLTDTNGDGLYDKQSVLADKFMFPEGVMCRGNEVFVAAPPSIWKLSEIDDKGVAQKRGEWFEGKTLTGCANDLHGPYAGPDGWIYWCKGAFAEQRYPRPGKKEFISKASHIFRARPDGTGVEPVMTGGMDNPVDVVFTPSGERIFSTTFFQHPGGGFRDGLIHAVYGGVYGKQHAVLDNHPRTGPDLMPVLAHMGPAAPAGLHRYESSAFGAEYRDNVFAVQFNLAKVSRHVLTPDGATFKSRDVDFVVSNNRDFHPTDVIEDADGSLLIVDTGGWYKLCCPTSQLVKPDVLGAVYRVRRKDAPKITDPRGAKIDWAKADVKQLTRLLGDSRPVVRRRAIEALASRKTLANGAESVEARRNAVWAATRIDNAEARAAVRSALGDKEESVRQVALHSVSLWRDGSSIREVLKLLESKSAHNRRAAAEALGRIGDASAVPALFAALEKPGDRFLEHSLIYALIEIGDVEAVKKGLDDKSARVRRAALLALDGMTEKSDSDPVLKELTSSDERMKQAAWYIAGRHPAWGEKLAKHFGERLQSSEKLSAKEKIELAEQLAGFAPADAIQVLIGTRLEKGGKDERAIVLRALESARLKTVPIPWKEPLLVSLDADKGLIAETIRALRNLPMNDRATPKLLARLHDLASDDKLSNETRVAALAAIPGSVGELKDPLFAFLSQCIGGERPISERGPAAGALSRSRLSDAQKLELARLLKSVGPMELESILDVYAKGKDEKIGLTLLASLEASPVRSSLHIDRLKARLLTYPDSVKQKGEALTALLDADRVKRVEQLDKLLPQVKKGDVRRGQLVFNSQKAACISCHAIGYVGGKIGPDLTRIGGVRDERDLLESILFPSVSLVRSYEPVEVTTKKGKVINGLVKRETAEELVLTLSATEEARIARREIESAIPSKVSIMPGGLEKVLTAQELADLVAFLKASR